MDRTEQLYVEQPAAEYALAAAAALLAGCTPYWQPNPSFADFEPRQIQITYADDLAPCASPVPVLGCAIRIKESRACFVYVKASQPLDMRRCVALHEARHCINGEDHETGRPNYAVDCGNGELRR